MAGVQRKPGGSTLVADEANAEPTARSDNAPGKHTRVEADVDATSDPASPAVARYEDMLRAVLAAETLTDRATHGDTAARARVLALLAPVEARLSQLNDHQGHFAQFGAGNIAGQAALDMSETAIRAWRQRLQLGTIVRADELVLRFRAGAEPIRFLTGEAHDAPTLRGFNRASATVGAGAAAPVLAPAALALVAGEAPLLAFMLRTSASQVATWAFTNPAAALAASELLLNYGVQIGESGWAGFWSQLDDPQGRWLFLVQILADYMHVQSSLHAAPARPGASPELPPDLAGAKQRLGAARQLLAHIDEEAGYTSAGITQGDTEGPPGGARKPKAPRFGEPAPDNPFKHVKQRKKDWCGAACGEMSARRLGVETDQKDIASTRHFMKKTTTGHWVRSGGFDYDGLEAALDEVAPVRGRYWKGGSMKQNISTPTGLLKHIKGYLASTKASIIFRVERSRHWILIDSVTPDDRFVIRDPGEQVSTIVTAEELQSMNPTGDVVMSFEEDE